jgi:surface antigen Omp85-like protein
MTIKASFVWFVACGFMHLMAAPLAAQGRDSTAVPDTTLPSEIAEEAANRFNAPATRVVVGTFELARDSTIPSNVAVTDGPVTVAGHITGSFTAINTNVTLAPGARIDGDLLIVGGSAIVPAPDSIIVAGPSLVFAQRLRYHTDSTGKIIVDESEASKNFWRRWLALRRRHSFNDFTITTGHTYNRVEGLPIYLGPTIHRETAWGSAGVDALGIVRTGDFVINSRTIGYRVAGDAQIGHARDGSVKFTARAYKDVAPVEDWQLSDAETGLSSFFFRRDYRDYYARHGGSGSVSLADGYADLNVTVANEHWSSLSALDPIYVFRTAGSWRPNPTLDDGTFQIVNAGLQLDTRNDRNDPWAGWFVKGNVEYGTGRIGIFGARSPPPPTALGATETGPPVGGPPASGRAAGTAYTRAFFDVRRYNRLGPTDQLNLRAVLAGSVGGPLPLERRFSVGGPGTIPGFDFRSPGDDHTDVASCSNGPRPAGSPAQCDRVALAQVEYRHDLRIDIGPTGHGIGFHRDGSISVFTDAGRGWLVGHRDGDLRYPTNAFPAPSTFLTDVGVGFVIDPVGVYLAKGLSYIQERPHVEIRVQHRF